MSEAALGQAEIVVRVIAQTAVDNEKYFCDLDAVVGDGDFGYSLARGFEVVLSRLGRDGVQRRRWPAEEDGDHPQQAHRRYVGPDLGDRIPACRQRAEQRSGTSGEEVIAAFRAAIEGIKQRGDTDLGDKTLLDALVPAVDELEAALPDGAAAAIERAAATAHGRAPKLRRACSRSADGLPTPASAAATRWTPEQSVSR